jgi:DNA-binding NarL/FixJ family response regulator
MAIKVFFADDHELFVQGVMSLLKDEPIDFIGKASIGSEIVKKVAIEIPDILLLDIEMPDMSGIEIARKIINSNPLINILILSNYNKVELVSEALSIGVKGFMLKTADKTDLMNAINTVSRGNSYFNTDIREKIVECITKPGESKISIKSQQKLSNREKEILSLIAIGLKNHEIAKKLYISTHTVITHRRNLLQKSGTKNTAGLVRFASMVGL